MISLSLEEIALATGGELRNVDTSNNNFPDHITTVCTDTRHIAEGCLFIALKGENFDAHQFLLEAQKLGATAFIVEQEGNIELPYVVVNNTRTALGQLGAYVKAKIKNLKCAAITGSNGKTTTKEMLSAILSVHCPVDGAVLSTAGNFNNDIGLPLTLLRLTEQTRFAVVELGANHQGEIAYTSALAKPDVALINNVMPAHLEGFGSIEGVAQAKGEIWSSLEASATGVVNLDAKFSQTYINQLKKQQTSILTFSQTDNSASVFATELEFDPLGRARFTLNYEQQQISICLNIAGQHNVSNALAAASMAIALGCDLNVISKGLASLELVAGRVNSLSINDNLMLIDDSYNANSASLKAAIDLLAQNSGETVLIFSDMGELGQYNEQEHRIVGQYAAEQQITVLLTVGQSTAFTHETFKSLSSHTCLHFDDKKVLKAHLHTYLQNKRNEKLTILVKGSRSTKMEEIVAYIKQQKIG
ncbi:UDP-N-acetylmuramoylalanyl-D-glutamyl-2, 6-diaminopimelate--D-alanyl-D-alanine ligase [Psychromonas sp. psych-6C06]|uniref:UDP-N-acetylmuramoyl-tripeptide--D-alanyl-D- alanine ligase n=1 Tax=Psychromonas sp. psych-6C06 TaxID=2058089 RepID=UPI000C328A72|nr:UDP-N-acetylmuramoyl-tripeptide--D-alanyl-D-alanine ligase [Psychromonas sp. psych-6C06]PKF62239.1 UDP-N-acetylmuramoylalanyl-D-glutamyl-2, 6-diaminopimelate--D-alanyl-D-alanine ligase [Psychromonas sp. psych-6C06]